MSSSTNTKHRARANNALFCKDEAEGTGSGTAHSVDILSDPGDPTPNDPIAMGDGNGDNCWASPETLIDNATGRGDNMKGAELE